MFKRIDHVEIVTDKPEETIAFYTDVLGFTVRERSRVPTGPDKALNLAYLDLGGTTVELMTWENVPTMPKPELEHFGYRMIAIEVEDMKEALAYLKTKGIDPVWGPNYRDTYARAEIADPNGYRIELRHWV
ncbi:MAG TPA: VOC family protein [Stellaceae bacterium]|jgi:glyoxylase I family protein